MSTIQEVSVLPKLVSPAILTLPDGIELRAYRENDIPGSIEHLNNVEVLKTLTNRIPHPYTEEDARSWIAFCTNEKDWIPSGPYQAEPKGEPAQLYPTQYAIIKDNQFIGAIGLTMQKDVYFRTAELGYWLAQPYWGQGIMGRVVPAFVKWAFDTFGVLHRIEAGAFEGNIASETILKKAGMKYEGRREEAIWKNGRFLANLHFGVVRQGE